MNERFETGFVMTSTISSVDPVPEFDYSYAASAWGLGFSVVIGFFVLGTCIGAVLKLIRHG